MKGKISLVPLLALGLVLLMLIYGYLLPVSEKCMIIPDLAECTGAEKVVIFSESPLKLEPSETATRYSFRNVQLFRRDSLEIATIFEEITVKKSWFASISARANFEVQEGGKDVKLFIFANSADGSLKVYINGKKLAKIKGQAVHEVSVPLGILKDSNKIEIKASTPLLPITSNKYELGKVLLREEYVITKNREVLDLNLKQDLKDIDRAILRFNTDCFSEQDLAVSINDKKVFNGLLCNGYQKDIADYLKETGNTISFTSEGNYYVERISLDVGSKQKVWPTYYFNVQEKKLESGLVKLKIAFSEASEKKLTLYLNKEALTIETRKKEFETSVNKFLQPGQNEIILIPETEMIIEKIELV